MRTQTGRWTARAALAVVLAALACGDGAPIIQNLVTEDFEVLCGDLPCDWTLIEGDPAQARYVHTFHSGEHGIELTGSDVTVRGPGGTPQPVQISFGSIQGRLVGVCDSGNQLTVRIGLRQAFDASGPPIADTLEADFFPSDDWNETDDRTLTASSAFRDGGFGTTPFTSGFFRVTGVTIEKSGGGSCTISRLIIDDILPARADGC